MNATPRTWLYSFREKLNLLVRNYDSSVDPFAFSIHDNFAVVC